MSYVADHLAWQQRVNQEFKAQSSQMDSQMFQNNGQWFNYPDLVNYLKTQQMEQGVVANQRKFGENNIPQIAAQMSKMQSMMDTQQQDVASNFSYTGKSKLIYQRKQGGSTRSKTSSKYGAGGVQRFNEAASGVYGAADGETRSKLSKAGLQRFNEELAPNVAPSQKSKVSAAALSGLKSMKPSQKSGMRAASLKSKPSAIVRQSVQKPEEEPKFDDVDVQIPVAGDALAEEANLAEEAQDEVGEMPEYLESASEMKPTASQISQMSGRTYISQLKKQLDDERMARVKLEGELEDLKKISSEITSHLSLIQKQQEEERLAGDEAK